MARKVEVTAPREGSKLAQAVKLLSGKKGVSKDLFESKVGRIDSAVWALGKKGYQVENIGTRGASIYRLA